MTDSRAEPHQEPTRRGSQVKGKRRYRPAHRSLKARKLRAELTERETKERE